MLTAFFKKGTNILIGNWLKQFREKNKRTIFVVTKLTYLVWTASLAGALDKWKSNIVDDYGDQSSLLNKYGITEAKLVNKMLKLIKND